MAGRDGADPRRSLLGAVAEALDGAGVGPGEGIVVAVSGGVDSVVLLDALQQLAPERGLRLHVAHLDHGVRPDSADDARFVADLARRLGLGCTAAIADVRQRARQEGLSLEQAGRTARRELFERVRRETASRWIALAHHADDQAETVLLRLLRGAGSRGLGAMAPARHDGYLRPLLSCRRAQILAVATARQLPFREDPTNRDLAIPRNRVRHELVPHLEQRHNPGVVDALNRAAALLRDEDAFLEQAAEQAAAAARLDGDGDRVTLDAPRLQGYHIALLRRVLRQYLQELAPGIEVGFAAVEATVQVLRSGPQGLRRIGHDLWGQRTAGHLILRRGRPPPVQTKVHLPGRTDVPGRPLSLQATFVAPAEYGRIQGQLGGWRVAFDGRVADADLAIRSPRPGDRLRPFGMGGRRKKLSDCFIDAKWPRILRSEALLVTRSHAGEGAGGEEILWVAGVARCDGFRVGGATERILYLEFVEAGAPDPGDGRPRRRGP